MAATAGSPHRLSMVTSTSPPAASRMRSVEVAVAVELDDRVGAELAQPRQALPAARGGDDAARAEALRRLHGDAADLAGGAEHEHGLARLAGPRAS